VARAKSHYIGTFRWLVQGTTARGEMEPAFDLSAFSTEPAQQVVARWRLLCKESGCPRAIHAGQVHGTDVLVHERGPPGLFIGQATDGHVTRAPGVLLTVTAADCVPIFIVDPEARAVASLHGGWRGVAAGILEAGLDRLGELTGSGRDALYLHLGPAICGRCYEVGPEVHAALRLPTPTSPKPVDLRGVLAQRALALGLSEDRISCSDHCTRCGDSPFFSHRAGHRGRQVGAIGVLPTAPG
jgi:YfiH family protein